MEATIHLDIMRPFEKCSQAPDETRNMSCSCGYTMSCIHCSILVFTVCSPRYQNHVHAHHALQYIICSIHTTLFHLFLSSILQSRPLVQTLQIHFYHSRILHELSTYTMRHNTELHFEEATMPWRRPQYYTADRQSPPADYSPSLSRPQGHSRTTTAPTLPQVRPQGHAPAPSYDHDECLRDNLKGRSLCEHTAMPSLEKARPMHDRSRTVPSEIHTQQQDSIGMPRARHVHFRMNNDTSHLPPLPYTQILDFDGTILSNRAPSCPVPATSIPGSQRPRIFESNHLATLNTCYAPRTNPISNFPRRQRPEHPNPFAPILPPLQIESPDLHAQSSCAPHLLAKASNDSLDGYNSPSLHSSPASAVSSVVVSPLSTPRSSTSSTSSASRLSRPFPDFPSVKSATPATQDSRAVGAPRLRPRPAPIQQRLRQDQNTASADAEVEKPRPDLNKPLPPLPSQPHPWNRDEHSPLYDRALMPLLLRATGKQHQAASIAGAGAPYAIHQSQQSKNKDPRLESPSTTTAMTRTTLTTFDDMLPHFPEPELAQPHLQSRHASPPHPKPSNPSNEYQRFSFDSVILCQHSAPTPGSWTTDADDARHAGIHGRKGY